MSDDAVIRNVSANFIPVAVNLYKVRKAQDPGGELFRSVQRQKDQYQGIWIVAPEGKVLAGHHDVKGHKTWTQEVLDTLAAGLSAFGPVQTRKVERVEQLPHRGVGTQPDGGTTLAISTRYLHRDRRDGPAVLDSLTVAAADWALLAPPEPRANVTWTVPESVARQLCRGLSPSSDQSTMPRPGEVTQVRLAGQVLDITDGQARLSFSGEIAATHVYEGKPSHGQARIKGIGQYDLQSKQLLSLLLVLEGTHRSPVPYDQPREIGAVLEWCKERPTK